MTTCVNEAFGSGRLTIMNSEESVENSSMSTKHILAAHARAWKSTTKSPSPSLTIEKGSLEDFFKKKNQVCHQEIW